MARGIYIYKELYDLINSKGILKKFTRCSNREINNFYKLKERERFIINKLLSEYEKEWFEDDAPQKINIADICSTALTKREYYTGLAFHALLSNPERYKYIADLVSRGRYSQVGAISDSAEKAVLLADALIEELNNNNNMK